MIGKVVAVWGVDDAVFDAPGLKSRLFARTRVKNCEGIGVVFVTTFDVNRVAAVDDNRAGEGEPA